MEKESKNPPRIYINPQDCHEIFGDLTQEQKGDLFDAIVEYYESGQMPDDKYIRAIFIPFKRGIDCDATRYVDKCAKRKAAAEARWQQRNAEKAASEKNANASNAMQTDANDANAFFAMQKDANDANIQLSTYNYQHTTNNNIIQGGKDTSAKLTPLPLKVEKLKFDWDGFVSFFNDTMRTTSIPQITKLTDKRKKAVTNLLKKYKKEDLAKVIQLAAQDDFLNGKNDRGWVADFDFIFRESKFIKILEGAYKHTAPTAPSSAPFESNVTKNLKLLVASTQPTQPQPQDSITDYSQIADDYDQYKQYARLSI